MANRKRKLTLAVGDPGCSDIYNDTSERGTIACDDGMDNDADGRADFRWDGFGDWDCTGPTETSGSD